MAEPRRSTSRALVCASCGTSFTCTGDVDCWCGAEPYRLPMPAIAPALDAAADCLCPQCLRRKAASAAG